MRNLLTSAALTVALSGLAVLPAQAAVTVFGDEAASQCSQAAIAGRSDTSSESYCTTALNEDTLSSEDRAGTFVNRGIMKLRREQFESSRVDFNAALALVPTMGEAWANRGAMWVGEKRYQAGLDDLNKGLSLGVKEKEKVYFNRALAYEGLDDEKSAYFDYQHALELKPGWVLPQKELLRFHVSQKPE
ncbi:MAG TPA: tetratricopeptide repeat protein [Caulobacteraceae bacterium]|jgi:tetratricopeptide (TPR) repeat protein